MVDCVLKLHSGLLWHGKIIQMLINISIVMHARVVASLIKGSKFAVSHVLLSPNIFVDDTVS